MTTLAFTQDMSFDKDGGGWEVSANITLLSIILQSVINAGMLTRAREN